MQWKLHVRFGGRAGETHLLKDGQGAPVRPLHRAPDARGKGLLLRRVGSLFKEDRGLGHRPPT
jgi:hypothetical protein